MTRRRLMVVAGEASGDLHAAGLVREARALDSGLEFYGVGGVRLREQGTEILVDAGQLSLVGLFEVLRHLPRIWRIKRGLVRRLEQDRPDALLLVDLPDFNLALAADAKRLGITVIYFISPQLWAWRAGRVATIRERVARMLVLFPFEERFYREHQVPVTFVGHPFADRIAPPPDKEAARRKLGLGRETLVIGLLPGSRHGEIERLLPTMLETARELQRSEPRAQFLLPIAATLDAATIEQRVGRSMLPIRCSREPIDLIADACDAALAASGTATLELAVRDLPTVVVYKVSTPTYLLARWLVKLPYISLVNLIAEEQLVPELIQSRFEPIAAARELLRLARPGADRERVRAGLARVRERLGAPGAYGRAARALLESLESSGRGGASGSLDTLRRSPQNPGR